MAYQIVLAEGAVQDLYEIAEFIARDNPQRAMTFVDELQQRISSTLTVAPLGGPVYKPPTRYFVVAGSVALYEVDEPTATVTVLHVVHSRTDWRRG